MMSKEGSIKTFKTTSRNPCAWVLGHGQISHIVKMHYFFKIFFFIQTKIKQTEGKVMMTEDEFTKNAN